MLRPVSFPIRSDGIVSTVISLKARFYMKYVRQIICIMLLSICVFTGAVYALPYTGGSNTAAKIRASETEPVPCSFHLMAQESGALDEEPGATDSDMLGQNKNGGTFEEEQDPDNTIESSSQTGCGKKEGDAGSGGQSQEAGGLTNQSPGVNGSADRNDAGSDKVSPVLTEDEGDRKESEITSAPDTEKGSCDAALSGYDAGSLDNDCSESENRILENTASGRQTDGQENAPDPVSGRKESVGGDAGAESAASGRIGSSEREGTLAGWSPQDSQQSESSSYESVPEDPSQSSLQSGEEPEETEDTKGTEAAQETEETEGTQETETDDTDPMFGLKVGEEKTIFLSSIQDDSDDLKLTAAGNSCTVKIKAKYNYDTVGVGNGNKKITNHYVVTYKNITATAYCIQPERSNPAESETFSISKLKDKALLAKVIYFANASKKNGGYFETYHTGFSEGKRFVITHIAAAKAAGSSHWADGVSDSGKKAAENLIAYAQKQKELPDSEISFSPSSAKGYVEDGVLRTEKIKLVATADNTAVLNLPSNVNLKNTTASSRSGSGKVRINASDEFYLTLPLPVCPDLSTSVAAAGAVDRDYSAYKITTDKDTQNLGLVFADGVTGENTANLSIQFTGKISISAVKTDAATGNALAGAVFGLFAGADMTELGSVTLGKDQLIEKALTLNDGIAYFGHSLTSGCPYYVKEISAPPGYCVNTADVYPFIWNPGSDSSVTMTFTNTFPNTPVKGEIGMVKTDRDIQAEGVSQGDAKLEGAVYGLYARENIVHPGTGQVLHAAGAQVANGVTDKAGRITWSDLWPGKYFIREISPSEGYTLDQTEYEANLPVQDQFHPLVRTDVVCTEQIIRQPFRILKQSGSEAGSSRPLEGAGFSAWLLSSLEKSGDTIDFNSASPVPLCADGSAQMFTDETGYAASVALPYGTYIVKETTVPKNHTPVQDFIVTINQHQPNEPQEWGTLLDVELCAKLKIIKKDSNSGEPVLNKEAWFKVFSVEEDKYVEQQCDPSSEELQSAYCTDKTGTLILPRPLRPGTYLIEEITPPEGYLKNPQKVTVIIDESMPVLKDEESGTVVEAVVEDTPVTGRIELEKKGPMLTGYDGTDFIYEVRGLPGACFTVKAAEDIERPDQKMGEDDKPIVLYHKDDTVAELKTDENGEAFVDNLPLGRYLVEETTAPYGCVLDSKPMEAELKSDGEHEVITIHLEAADPKQKIAVEVIKRSSEGTHEPLSGAEFTLYAAQDIRAAASAAGEEGDVIVQCNTALAKVVTDAGGKAVFTQDLPHACYTIKETKAPEGYLLNDEEISCDASYVSGTETVLSIVKELQDTPQPPHETEPEKKVLSDHVKESETVQETNPPQTTYVRQTYAPATGDASPLMLLLALFGGSALILVIFLVMDKRKRKNRRRPGR